MEELLKVVQASAPRKKRATLWLDLYHDQQSQNLLELIQQHWKDADSFRLFHVNMVRKTINRKSMVYKLAPVRSFEGWDQDAGEELYRALRADTLLKTANRLVKLLKSCMLQVGWDEESETPTISILTPSILDVVGDDPRRPSRVIVTHLAASEKDIQYSDWTSSAFARVDSRGRPLPLEGNESGTNPYRCLPFVGLFDREPDGDFFLKGGEDLIEAQQAVNVGLANLWRSVEWQANGQAWVAGVDDDDANPAHVGPTTVWTFKDANASMHFDVPSGDIEGILKAIEFVIKQVAVTNDLAANVFEIDPRAESAAAKNAENRDLLEARQDDIELWREYEKGLFEMIKAVVNTHRPGSIPEGAEISVDFGEIGETLSDRDRLENYQRRIDLGIWSPVDVVMADNPDVRTRDEAIEILTQRQQESAIFSPSLPGPNFGVIDDRTSSDT